MATLRKRGSKWHVQVRRSGHNQTRSFSLKADAESWTRLVERGIDTGAIDDGSIPNSSMSVGDLLRRYSAEILPSKKIFQVGIRSGTKLEFFEIRVKSLIDRLRLATKIVFVGICLSLFKRSDLYRRCATGIGKNTASQKCTRMFF